MARKACGRLRIVVLCRLTVHARQQLLDLVAVAPATQLGNKRGGRFCVMGGVVAHDAGIAARSQSGMDALGHRRRLLAMARGAIQSCDVFRMREAFDIRMAIGASENRMDAGLVLRRIDENALARGGFEIFLTMTSAAVRIGKWLRLRTNGRRREDDHESNGNQQSPRGNFAYSAARH